MTRWQIRCQISFNIERERSPPLPIPPPAGSLQPPCQHRCSEFMKICSINQDYSDGTDHNDIYDWEDEEPNKHFINDDEGLRLPSVIKVVMRKVTLRKRGMMT